MTLYQPSPSRLRDAIIRQAFGSNTPKDAERWALVEKACKAMHAGKWDSVVYFLRLESRIKIGTTVDSQNRLAAIPWDSVELFIRGDVAEEQVLHEKFAQYRLQGEWFQAAPELIEYIEAMRAKLEEENAIRFPTMPSFPWPIGTRIPTRSDVQKTYLRYHLRDHLPSAA